MGMKAMYLVEAKTRVAKLDGELRALTSTVDKASADQRDRSQEQLEGFRARLGQIQYDVALLGGIDETDWGEFSTEIDDAIHQLGYDMDVLRAELEEGADARVRMPVN